MTPRKDAQLSVSTTEIDGRPVVTLSGTLDGWQYQTVLDSLQDCVSYERHPMIVDLSELTFASIGGMYALVEALRSVQYDVKVYAVATGEVARVLHRTRFDLRVSLCASLDEAVKLALPKDAGFPARLLGLSEDDDLPMAA